MCEHHKDKVCKKHPSTISLDTLAQLGTPYLKPSKKGNHSVLTFDTKFNAENSDNLDPNGEFPTLTKGTLFDDKKAIHKAQKRKYLASNLAHGLVTCKEGQHKYEVEELLKLGKSKSTLYRLETERNQERKSYWNMYHCSRRAEKEGNLIKWKYCKNRLCMRCSNIRTAELMAKYQCVLDEWLKNGELYFVTLTAKTIVKNDLKSNIDQRFKIFKKIQARFKKRYQRQNNDYSKFEGLRKLECTYNPKTNKYHPHFHILVRGKEQAEDLLNMWIKEAAHLGIDTQAQDIKKADKNAVKELFKYFTKVVSAASKTDTNRAIYLDAVDTIYSAIKGKRTFQSFGFKIADYQTKEQEVIEEAELTKEEELQEIRENEPPEVFEWVDKLADWQSLKTGELASGKRISDSLVDICKSMKLPSKFSNMIIRDFAKTRTKEDLERFKEISYLTEKEKRDLLSIEVEKSFDDTKPTTNKNKISVLIPSVQVSVNSIEVGDIIKIREYWRTISKIRYINKDTKKQTEFNSFLVEYDNVFQVLFDPSEMVTLKTNSINKKCL